MELKSSEDRGLYVTAQELLLLHLHTEMRRPLWNQFRALTSHHSKLTAN